MRGLVDDPRVLEAALALVDDYYATKSDEKGGRHLNASVSDSGHRKQELTRLRLTIRELLLDSVAERRRCETPRPEEADQCVVVNGDSSGREDGEEETRAIRTQARRVLKAARSYNQRLRAAHRFMFRLGESVSARAVDDYRLVDSMRRRLDALTRIARANCSSSPRTSAASAEPPPAKGSLKGHSQFGFHLPFKLSVVADVIWKSNLLMDFGRCRDVDELFTQGQDELMAMISSSYYTFAGAFALSGHTAVRRVYEDDGSVIFVYASIGSGSAKSIASPMSSNAPNLLAGCVFKDAGWTRMSRVPPSSGTRPKVLLEMAQSFVVEAMPGHCVSTRQLVGISDVMKQQAMQEPRTRQWLDNRLMDHSMSTGTSSP